MGTVRVLLVDDAAAIRRLAAAALHRDPALEVVGTAADGRAALARLDELRPDVIVLDLEMPVMDGLETLTALRQTHPRLPVIMFSSHTQRGVEATVRALTLGADDYVPKPGNGLDVTECIDGLLIPKIKLLASRGTAATVAPPVAASSRPGTQRVELLVIGASTGGPNALTTLFASFPPTWSVPTAVVQHMPPGFTARLAERLAEQSRLQVREAVPGAPLRAAQVWVAPGGQHLHIKRQCLALSQDELVCSCRPSVDVLFRSAAESHGAGVLAVVLTGMGQDGLRGCEDVQTAGGQVLVQDEPSSVVWSMPGAVARAGLANQVLPLTELGPAIVRRAMMPVR